MHTIIMILVGIWLLKAFVETGYGLLQIAAGLVIGLFGAILYVLSFPVEWVEKLWRQAFGK